ncbi:MAG TPA: pyrroloquinoline quinone biosynthesis peptide chaperone PqqD [Polyangiaceae bacterium]|nr:pyrroloquinoline quinone biosynthesis peptide chaperone PqqD [Polyangiaceae bacterium]
MIDVASVVRLAPKARLRFDRLRQQHMLLYPERGIVLSATAADVVALLDDTCEVKSIVEQLVAKYGEANRAAIARDVLELLRDLAGRGLVAEVTP